MLTSIAVWAADHETVTSVNPDVVAVVNGEEIFMQDLGNALAAQHANIKGEVSAGRIDYRKVLHRLINVRLIVQEARDTGLPERDDIKKSVNDYRERVLINLIKNRRVENLKPNEEEVERIYRDRIRHWKFKALSFGDEAQAQLFHDEINGGADFQETGEKYVERGSAAWEGQDQAIREMEIAPQYAGLFRDREAGSVTPVIKESNRFFVLKLLDVTYVEDPLEKQKVTRELLKEQRKKALEKYVDELIAEYVSIDKGVLSTMGKENLADLEKDGRVVAQIKGGQSVSIADLASFAQRKFYHGDKSSAFKKALVSDPESTLKELLGDKLCLKKALQEKLDETDNYKALVTDYENSILFSAYLKAFLAPQAQVSEEEVRAAYDESSNEYLMPQMIVIDSLTFTDRQGARDASERLKRGDDFQWLSQHSKGIKGEGAVRQSLILNKLPGELQSLFSKAEVGDIRLYENGKSSRLFVVRDVPPRKKWPYKDVRSQIAGELFNKRLEQAIENLADELRALSDITINEKTLEKGFLPLNQGENRR